MSSKRQNTCHKSCTVDIYVTRRKAKFGSEFNLHQISGKYKQLTDFIDLAQYLTLHQNRFLLQFQIECHHINCLVND